MPVCGQSLLGVFATIADPRGRRGRRHDLAGVLAIATAAVCAGASSLVAIAEWAADVGRDLLATSGLLRPGRRVPSESTIRRILQALDADELSAMVGAWLLARDATRWKGRMVVAVDGKTLRGAKTRDMAAPHLLAAVTRGGIVAAQHQLPAKTGEIAALPVLLESLPSSKIVVTADALYTQRSTACTLTGQGHDYVLTVKGNQPRLRTALKALPWKNIPAHHSTTTGHGRRVRRTIKVCQVPDWIDWPGARQVAQLRRTRTIDGRKTVEVVYLITSLDARQTSPADLADLIQSHWGIENRLHWVRDVTFDEDRHQLHTGHGPAVMATLRNTAISLHRLAGAVSIAAALRHHSRDPLRPLQLITQPRQNP